jgi:hypothetical protein
MDLILSKDQLLKLEKPIVYDLHEGDSLESKRIAFEEQFSSSLKSIANGISVYWHHREPGKRNIYKYHFSPGAYRLYKYKLDCMNSWMKPYLEHFIGPQDKSADILKERFEKAFPGFSSIRVAHLGDWSYSVDIDLSE